MIASAIRACPSCPFCGGAAERDTWDASRDYIGCRACDFWTRAEIWNRRSSPAQDAGLLRAGGSFAVDLDSLLRDYEARALPVPPRLIRTLFENHQAHLANAEQP